ncbi:winged helix-turn-helix transcriptional regulator [Kibdelosporangium lantanae]|uniref:Winged helix-turn-helix transcriptional regulator n=1 Tax=Kibdelosporangium lantanae TaxID=1497396 RepID=A0ABW3ML25_9PSEU
MPWAGYLHHVPCGHAEFRRRVAGITQKMLTETLRDMERDRLVERRAALGKTLAEPLAAICAWVTEHP